MTTMQQNEIESIPGVDDTPNTPPQLAPEQLAAAEKVFEMLEDVKPLLGGAVEKGIDRAYAQKPWSHQDKKRVGDATFNTIMYYFPSEYFMHPVVMLAIAIGSVGVKNADHEEQEARRNPPKEEEETAEVETPKPKRGRPKKNGATG